MIFIPKHGVGVVEEVVCHLCYGAVQAEGLMPWALSVGIVAAGPEPDHTILGFALMKTKDGYFYYETMEPVEVNGSSKRLRVFV
jgi:hypothetical protein